MFLRTFSRGATNAVDDPIAGMRQTRIVISFSTAVTPGGRPGRLLRLLPLGL